MDHQSQKGFTLIEVMVALMVLSIGLGALLVATTENTRVRRVKCSRTRSGRDTGEPMCRVKMPPEASASLQSRKNASS